MTKSLVLTVIGPDKPGLVESLSQTIAAHNGNWLESRMASLAGQFAGILLASVPDASADALAQAVQALDSQGLHVTVTSSAGEDSRDSHRTITLDLVGQDHPGIVREISQALASRNISVDELTTECKSASMAGGTLFHASARLSVPPGIPADELRRVLEDLANELMVDITLDNSPDE